MHIAVPKKASYLHAAKQRFRWQSAERRPHPVASAQILYYRSPIKDTMHTSMELVILISLFGIDLTCLPTLVKQRRDMDEANERSPK